MDKITLREMDEAASAMLSGMTKYGPCNKCGGVIKPCRCTLLAERDALAEQVRELRELAIWMTGCGYDFTQHEYFQAKKSLLSCGPPRSEAEGGS